MSSLVSLLQVIANGWWPSAWLKHLSANHWFESHHAIRRFPFSPRSWLSSTLVGVFLKVFSPILYITSFGGDVKPLFLGCWLVLALSCYFRSIR